MNKETVVLMGASGCMGYEAFRELWRRREKYNIVLLLLETPAEKKLFRKYAKKAGIHPFPGKGVVEGKGLKIVWGDARVYADVEEAIRGADWVLNAMALISPQADYYPEAAYGVNVGAITNIIKAIEAQPGGAERIKYIHTGTVAETGDRLPPIHVGRVGDPLKPSVFDYYAVTKIAGERAVLESRLKYWASLRMSFIIPVDFQDYLNLWEPIMFHQPIRTCMENISSRDAGYGLVNCLDIPADSNFWRKVYNMGGGPSMRCSALGFMDQALGLGGISSVKAVTERRWFALMNFHMQYFEDSHLANHYLGFWRDSLEDCLVSLAESRPIGIKLASWLSRTFPFVQKEVERRTHRQMRRMAEDHRNGTGYWVKSGNDWRVSAFYKDYSTYQNIPGWEGDLPAVVPDLEWTRLDHGFDEQQGMLTLHDLREAALFRGGECLAQEWNGDLYQTVPWKCARGHKFSGKPYTILFAGHWCPDCMPPPWDYDREARINPFFAQVWYPNHEQNENNLYPGECLEDVAGADRDPF